MTCQEWSGDMQNTIIDNILIKLVNITFSRAVMTLAGTLEVQVCSTNLVLKGFHNEFLLVIFFLDIRIHAIWSSNP